MCSCPCSLSYISLVPPDEVDAVSPENSPPLDRDRDREYSVEEALFLKKNFESLEKSEGLFLNVPNPRLSISAKFLERNMRQVKAGYSVLTKPSVRHVGRVWFGWSLQPH